MKTFKWILSAILISALFLLGACQNKIATEAEMGQAFQTALDDVVDKNDNVHNAVMMVEGSEFTWQGASGMADPDAGITMLPDDQYRSASSAKTMLATLTLKLAEEGVLSLDEPIAAYLAADIIDGLHIFGGEDYSEVITTRQLLHHTTGLADEWFDERDEGRFIQLILEEETDKLWEPVERVDDVKANLPPRFAPGDDINYSDVNYVLVGLVIEATTGQPLHEVYQVELFEPLGMRHTYMEFREEPRPNDSTRGLSHVYYGDVDYTTFRSLSADWAGGGLVTTAADMTRFLRAFANDEIFANPESREAMFDWQLWQGDTVDYGLGVFRVREQQFTFWGHLGVGQAFMFYWPDEDVTICGTVNQDEVNVFSGLLSPVMQAVESYQG